ncbi:MAG TPA: hypothetical protein VFV94_20660 [Polyangiaceae bacterium]|nr:hypothetical protein [Polyangiaceae bacterium]
MPELPPNAVRAAAVSATPSVNKAQPFNRLSAEFKSLLAALRGLPSGVVSRPADIAGTLLGPGQLEPPAGGALGRRPPTGEPELVGDLLDPLCRSLAALGPSVLAPEAPSSAALASAPGPLGIIELAAVEEAVRRVAWGGDRRAGVARIELGGAYIGTAIVVRGAGREVALSIELGSGADAGSLPQRLVERLRARGLAVTDVEVR